MKADKKKTFKKIWNIISTVLVAVVVLCAVFLMGSRLLGYQVYTVISGSMEPEYSVGDLIYVKPLTAAEKESIEASGIKVHDTITFLLNQDLVVATHRVERIDEENLLLYTKGDANDVEDGSPVHLQNVIGKPSLAIPKLGYVSDFVQNPPGMYITLAVGAVLILLVFLPDLIVRKRTEETKDESEKSEEQTPNS